MNKFIALWLSVLVTTLAFVNAAAQEMKMVSLPQPPFVNNTATYSTWTISFTPDHPDSKPSPALANGAFLRALKEVHVAKMDKDFQEIQSWSDGLKTQKWEFQGMAVVEQPGSSAVYVFDEKRLLSQVAQSLFLHSKSDFPELSWLTANAYAGVKTYQGRPCYWFQIRAPLAQNQSAPQAWVDAKTRLPLAFDDGTTLRVYSFEDAVPHQPELPPRFAEALKNYQNDDLGTPRPGMMR